ncbi:MAG: plasmid partitioning protein ParA [Rhodospirillales bacterium]|nr:plasmid partitioning protein ParA [Rhodospirillales bacterium]
MITVLIANSKGGCGKSTLSANLAAALALAGHEVMLADADRQKSATAWAKRRPETARSITIADWTKGPGEVPKKITRLVIDGPAALRKDGFEALVAEADLVVMPVLPSSFDQDASTAFLEKLEALKSIRKNRKGVAIVGNRMRDRTRAADRLDRFLSGLGHAVVARIRDSQAYGEAAVQGLSIFEIKGVRSALRADWEPLIDYIEHGVL